MQQKVLSDDEGKLLIKIARENIHDYLIGEKYEIPSNLPKIFYEKLGVFVTLNLHNNLRGCIGYPEPYKPLIDALLDVSLAAAFDDPRFKPLTSQEYEDIDIEISVLTKPKEVLIDKYDEYFKKLKIGFDGLIIENGYHRGLLLPQVPIEQNWNMEEYLENLCYKAGLYADAWKDEKTRIYNFQAQIFHE